MTESNIIPFPTRPSADQDRLENSLSSLQSALEEQRRALRDWRFAMAELGISVAGLGAALGTYQQTLGGVETKLGELRDNSARLEGWADEILAESAGTAPKLPDRPDQPGIKKRGQPRFSAHDRKRRRL